MIVLENIQNEINKNESIRRWKDLRTDQHTEYNQMICVPVMWRKSESKYVNFIGVISIDTNRSRYFKDTIDDKEFLSCLLAPFLRAIMLSYIIYPEEENDGQNENSSNISSSV